MNERQLTDDKVEQLLRIAGARPRVPEHRAARARANVRDAWRAGVQARRFRRRALWAAPLAAAAMIALVFVLIPRPEIAPAVAAPIATVERVTGEARVAGLPIGAGDRVPMHAAIVTRLSSRAAFRLSDGTSVRADERSRLRFDGPRRIIIDDGAVYIDAVHSGLEVQTPFGAVRDIGTRFEVRVDGDAARIRVRDGIVSAGSHRAGKGEQLEMTSRGIASSRIATWGRDWEWASSVAPPFSLEGKRVTELLVWVAGESGAEVRFDSPATARRAAAATLHGSVRDVPPLPAAEAILPTAGMRASFAGGVLTVRAQ